MKVLTVIATLNPKSFCHAWDWTQYKCTIPIPGFKTIVQVQENMHAIEFGLLSNEQMKKIDEVFERAGDLLGL